MFLGLPELSNVYGTHHDDSSGATESQDAATEAAGSSSQRQDPGEGMPPPIGQALSTWYGNTRLVVLEVTAREREIRVSCVEPSSTTRARSLEPAADERKLHSNWTVKGRTKLDLVKDEVDEAKRLLEEAHVEVQAAQNEVTEAAFRVGQAMEEMAQIRKPLEGESGANRSMKIGQKKRLLGGIKKTKATWERWYEVIMEEEKLQSKKCMQSCSTPLPTCEEELSCNIPVFWWLWHTKKTHISAYRSSMQPGSRSFEAHTYCCGY